MNFSREEMVDMVYVLGASDKNCLLATRIYMQRYPERRQPSKKSFERLMERFDNTGKVVYEKKERTKNVVNEENETVILLSVIEDPHRSTRELARENDISRSSVHRILRKNKFHPYHVQLVQELIDRDYENRMQFCQWAQQKIGEQRNFFDYVLFVDEASFHKNGHVNRHNFHYYDTINPYILRTHSQTRWTLNTWGGIVGDYVIGPHFFEGRVNGQVYLEFLQNNLEELLEDVPRDIRDRMWYLHDGAPVHHTAAIHEHLNVTFPNSRIGRGGPHGWPTRSPDLTKMEFFLWGYVKEQVYKTPTTTKEDMKNRIREVFQNITVAILRNVSRSIENRLQTCIDVLGRHFEQLL